MAHHPTWRPDSKELDPSEIVPAEAVAREASPPTADHAVDDLSAAREELAKLAAQLGAQVGGDPPLEIPGEFAEDAALKDLADQACLATGATGAAIALARGGEIVCRARSGSGVPELGTPLDMNSELLVACARTRQIQSCNDALNDPGAAEILRDSGASSLVLLPLVRDEELIGIFEVVSSRTHAFGDRDLQTLKVLAGRILKNSQAHQSSSVSAELIGASNEISEPLRSELASFLPVSDGVPDATESRRTVWGVDWVTGGMGAVLLAVAIVMGAGLGMRLGWVGGRARASAAQAASQIPTPPVAAPAEPAARPEAESIPAEKKPAKLPSEPRAKRASIPEGELRVYENGKEIFHVPPGQGDDTTASSTENGKTTEGRLGPASLVELSPHAAEGVLVHRVEPEYPEQALMQHVQGRVVLDVHADRNGIVQDVTQLSGDLLLGEAATAAVRQWRFKPQRLHGEPVDMETKVTLRFTLPPS